MPVSHFIQKVCEGMITFKRCECIFLTINNINQYNNIIIQNKRKFQGIMFIALKFRTFLNCAQGEQIIK